MDTDPLDRSGLIRESYAIDGIRIEECRSIFLDWALKLPEGTPTATAIRAMLDKYGAPGHPMTEVLNEGLVQPTRTGRRGGARARRAD